MAYNPYPYQYQYPQFQAQSQQIQNGGFISARSIEEAYNWPVAPGNSLTFRIENTPYVCTKTKGFSPLEQPVFERYRLVKEDDATQASQQKAPKEPKESKASEETAMGAKYDEQIRKLWDEINAIKGRLGKGKQRHDKPADDHTGEAVSQ